MKKYPLLICALWLTLPLPCWAEINLEPLLNKVTLQLSATQWITTKTALVNVGINAAVTDQGVEKIQADVLQKLTSLSDKGEWHILSFNRQQDKSGLESIQISAQARLPQSAMANLRTKAKALSSQGETFTIDDVQFTPSDDEIKQANTALRNDLYQQAKAEVDVLNKTYTDQKYYLHQIDFVNQISPPVPMPMMRSAMAMVKMGDNASAPLSIGNKVELDATVVLAAMPDQVAQKLAHS